MYQIRRHAGTGFEPRFFQLIQEFDPEILENYAEAMRFGDHDIVHHLIPIYGVNEVERHLYAFLFNVQVPGSMLPIEVVSMAIMKRIREGENELDPMTFIEAEYNLAALADKVSRLVSQKGPLYSRYADRFPSRKVFEYAVVDTLIMGAIRHAGRILTFRNPVIKELIQTYKLPDKDAYVNFTALIHRLNVAASNQGRAFLRPEELLKLYCDAALDPRTYHRDFPIDEIVGDYAFKNGVLSLRRFESKPLADERERNLLRAQLDFLRKEGVLA